MYVYFDDEAGPSADTMCSNGTPALSGAYRPYQALSAFDGETWAGTWTINIADVFPPDTGQALGGQFYVTFP
jgi:hypothetical protein